MLPAGADRPYPAASRSLHRRIPERGLLVSELAPGASLRRWMFLARNRIIAALSAMTVVVQARSGSGALVTARWARELGRRVGAVPGEVVSPLSVGPHRLLRDGADLIGGAQDVLDGLFGAGERRVPGQGRPPLPPPMAALLDALGGRAAGGGRVRTGAAGPVDGLGALAALELDGLDPARAGGRGDGDRLRRVRWRPGAHPLPAERRTRALGSRGDPDGLSRRAIPRVLSIAGSDSGGGAGIQADLKAFAACGVHGMTAITAITAQNTVGVTAVQAIDPDVILAQVRAVAQDIGVDAVKIGMLGTVATIEAVAAGARRADRPTRRWCSTR